MSRDCIFCKIAKGEMKRDFVKESDNFFAMRDIKPISDGHTLVIPKKHFVTLLDIPDKLSRELVKLIKEVAGDVLDNKIGDGFNIIMNNLECSGQIVMHAHLHIIPRKDGDGIDFFPHGINGSGEN